MTGYVSDQKKPASPTTAHGYWGRFTNAAELPNVSGSSFQNPGVDFGDIAWSDADGSLYVCVDPTPSAAIWTGMSNSGGASPVSPSAALQFAALDPQATLAAQVDGYSVAPLGRVRLTPRTDMAPLGSPVTLAYVSTRAGLGVSFSVRHRGAGAVATVITYTLWVNNVPTAQTVAIAANSAASGTTIDAARAIAVGDRIEVILSVAADIAAGNMPDDIIAYVSY